MKAESDDKDGEDGEEEKRVQRHRLAAGAQAAEVYLTLGARNLQGETRREQHEQHHPDYHRRPVRHVPMAMQLASIAETIWTIQSQDGYDLTRHLVF